MSRDVILKYSSGKKGDSFVGLKLIDGQVHLFLPEQYGLYVEGGIIDADSIDNYREELSGFLCALSLTTGSDDDEDSQDHPASGSERLVFDSYLWILEDYLANGMPFRYERTCSIGNSGRIVWKPTIQKCKPIVSGGNLIYLQTYRNRNMVFDDIVQEAYLYCLNESMKYAGWLFCLDPLPEKAFDFSPEKKDIYLYETRRRLDATFEEVRKLRLHHMSNIISAMDVFVDQKKTKYGVNSFHKVFENMIDDLFGNINNLTDFKPRGAYFLHGDKPKSFNLIPDTIMTGNRKVYVIDSKFYRYGSSEKASDLPDASSILKQIAYGDYIERKMAAEYDTIYNVFMVPYRKESDMAMKWTGFAGTDWKPNDKHHHIIHVVKIDLRFVLLSWAGIKKHDWRGELSLLMDLNNHDGYKLKVQD